MDGSSSREQTAREGAQGGQRFRVVSCSSIVALGSAGLGAALLPYVFVGMVGMVLSFVALVLAFRVAMSVFEADEGAPRSMWLIIGGVLTLAVATAEMALAVPSLMRPDDFRGGTEMLGLWVSLSLVGPSMVAAGVRDAIGLGDARTLQVWLYWLSFPLAAVAASGFISLLGWGGRA